MQSIHIIFIFEILAVDQIPVLVNGERRHKSDNTNFGGKGNGSTGYDLNAIPINAIERIELLRDGLPRSTGPMRLPV